MELVWSFYYLSIYVEPIFSWAIGHSSIKKASPFLASMLEFADKANSFANAYKPLLFLASTPMPRRVSPFSIIDNEWGMNPARETFSYWAFEISNGCCVGVPEPSYTYTFSYSLYNNLMHLKNPGCIKGGICRLAQ